MHKHHPSLLANAHTIRRDSTDVGHCLWQNLRRGRLLGYKFRRQESIRPYIADFLWLWTCL